MCVFQLDLFSAEGPDAERRCSTSRSARRTSATRAARASTPTSSATCRPCAGPSAASSDILPDDLQGHPRLASCSTSISCDAAITIVHLIHRRAAYCHAVQRLRVLPLHRRRALARRPRRRRAHVQSSGLEERERAQGGRDRARSDRRSSATLSERHRRRHMNIDRRPKRAFAMPLTSPAFPKGPYRFYRPRIPDHHLPHRPRGARGGGARAAHVRRAASSNTSSSACRTRPGSAITPRSGQVIPVKFKGKDGGYTHAMFLNDGPPIYGGRELWGFPKKYAQPALGARQGYAGRHARLRPRARRHRHDGLQAQGARS